MSALVTRPTVPPLAWCATGVFVGVLLAEAFSWRRFAGGGMLGADVTGAAIALTCGLVLLAWLGTRRGHGQVPIVLLVALGVALGMASGSATWARWHAARASLEGRPSEVAGTVTRDPQLGRAGWSLSVGPDSAPGAVLRVFLGPDEDPPEAAMRIRFGGAVEALDAADEWARRSHQRGEAGSVRVSRVEELGWSSGPQGRAGPVRSRLRELVARVEGPGGDLLLGVLLGDRTRLAGTQVDEDLRICGLSHLLAVSGSHLSIVAVLVTWIATRSRRGVRGRVGMVAAAALVYVVMTGIQASALRSLVMGTLAGLAALTGRRSNGLAGLSVATASMLIVNPYVAFDVGFRLSVSAVAGLLVFATLATRWAETALGRRGRRLASPVALTLVAQTATLPVAIPLFQVLSLVSPLANLCAVPLVTVSLAGGLAGGLIGLVSPALGTWLLWLASLPLEGVAFVSRWLGALPGAAVGLEAGAVALGSAALMVGVWLWAWWPQPRSRRRARIVATATLAVIMLGMVGTPRAGHAGLVVLDVGQGDAILARDGGHAVLIDTGADPQALRTALTREGVRRLDALILTHDHADHTGGIAGLVGLARVEQVFVPAVADEDAFATVRDDIERLVGQDAARPDGTVGEALEAGDAFTLGSTTLTVLWPDGPDPGLSTNDTSVVLEVTRGAFSAVLTGDAEEHVWRALAERGALRPVDVLKVPHHGSTNGLTADALEAWDPAVAIISVGQPNDFAHPAPETVGLLEQAGTTVMRTDRDGSVSAIPSGEGFSIKAGTSRRTDAAYATIGLAHPLGGTRLRPPDDQGDHGSPRPQRPEAGVPHLRPRGALARSGSGTLEAASLGTRRPGLQPRRVRWGHSAAGRCRGRREHAPIHVRAPPRHPAQGRSSNSGCPGCPG